MKRGSCATGSFRLRHDGRHLLRRRPALALMSPMGLLDCRSPRADMALLYQLTSAQY
jgi:hypothetical protein